MIKLSEKKEEELWQLFDSYTRGWNYSKIENYFKFENQTFNDFLFFLEENTSWFNWKEVEIINKTISEYIHLQEFLRNNKTNI
jgi:hypothetical protein